MYNFMKQNYIEVERGIEYMNYQREVAILTGFWQKTAKRSKNEEINRKKSQKLTKKSRNMCQFRIWNAISGYAKNCAINFRGLHFNIASIKNYLYKKPNYKQKKLGHLDEKTVKNGYLYVPFSQKLLFNVKKSFTKLSAWSKNFSRSEKISSHCNFTRFRF